jgi:two-component system phosphate regulon sensor histidine kinase PhoR
MNDTVKEHAPLPWSIFDNLPEPVLVLDAARTVVSANRAAQELLGQSVEGRDMALALRQPAALSAAGAALAGEQPEPAEITFTTGAPRTFEVRAAPVPGNGPARAVITLHDTTGEKRAEGMRVDFVANVSHELRSPLASLLGFIETLRGAAKDDPEARERFLGIMQSEAERMARLIDDLLSLSRVEADEHIQPRDPVALEPLLGRAIDVVRARADERRVTIRLDLPAELPEVAGDNDQLMQVFQNLLDNAVKYGRPDSEVVIGVEPVDRVPGTARPGLAVRVTDQGEGIPQADLSRLTERFYRVDKARSRALGGTGLGLAIVKHIVGRHRGRLTIDSEEDVGSTFTVVLPVYRP